MRATYLLVLLLLFVNVFSLCEDTNSRYHWFERAVAGFQRWLQQQKQPEFRPALITLPEPPNWNQAEHTSRLLTRPDQGQSGENLDVSFPRFRPFQ